jgi:hypothetical protein
MLQLIGEQPDYMHVPNLEIHATCANGTMSNLMDLDGYSFYPDPFGVTYLPICWFTMAIILSGM